MVDAANIIYEYLTATDSPTVTGVLSDDISSSATSFDLDDASLFPSNRSFVVRIGAEAFICTRSGNTLTVSAGIRGRFGTTAAAHTSGSTIYLSTFNDLVGASVYLNAVPRSYNGSTPICVITPTAGAGPVLFAPNAPDIQVTTIGVQTECYGGSLNPRDARAVDALLFDRMHNRTNIQTNEGWIVQIEQETAGQNVPNRDIVAGDTLPVIVSVYSVTVKN